VLLQDLQDGLHQRPRGAAHVNHHREPELPHVIAEKKTFFIVYSLFFLM
jgi:hypothetical protein